MGHKHSIEDESRELRKYWQNACEEEEKEDNRTNPILRYFSYKNFISHSNGRHRKGRKSREIELVTVNHTGKTITLKDVPTRGLDFLAREALTGSANHDDDHFRIVVDYLRNHFNRKK